MKKIYLFILVLALGLTISENCFAQNKIKLTYTRPGLNQLYLSNLWDIELTNLTNDQVEFYLYGTLKEKKAGLIATGTTVAMKLNPKEKKKFKVNELPQTTDISYPNSDPRFKEALMRKGSLPNGSYEVCVVAKEKGTNDEISMQECFDQEIVEIFEKEITLLTPDNNETLDPSLPITFSWTPIADSRSYKIRIVEIKGDESPENAMLKNKAFFEKEDIRMTTYQYPSSAPKFEEGKKYAWQISKEKLNSLIGVFSIGKKTIKKEIVEPVPNVWQRYVNAGFIENRGQFNRSASGEPVDLENAPFLKADLKNCYFLLTNKGFTYIFFEAIENESENEEIDYEDYRFKDSEIEYKYNRIGYIFDKISIKKENIQYEEPDNQGVMHYYFENHPEGILNVPVYKKVTIKNVYFNTDLILFGNDVKGIKYEFVVRPGGDPSKIKFNIVGAKEIDLMNDGEKLKIQHDFSSFEDGPLKVFYTDNWERISSKYITLGTNKFQIKTDSYDKSKTIVVDPLMNVYWATLYAGNGADGPTSIRSDNGNNIYICGYNSGPPLPVLLTGITEHRGSVWGTSDCFIIKFNSEGIRQWGTLFGGEGTDRANCMNVFNDKIFVAGNATEGLPMIGNSIDNTYNGGNPYGDAFLLKFNVNGEIEWSTYYGGSRADPVNNMFIDLTGKIYLTGHSTSSDFPVFTDGTFTNPQNIYIPNPIRSDAFLLVIDGLCFGNTPQLKWATCYGGTDSDMGQGIVVNSNGEIYFAGSSRSSELPVSGSGYTQNLIGTLPDVFLVKYSSSGIPLWSTYFGGNAYEFLECLSLDNEDNLIIGGKTLSPDFPVFNTNEGTIFANSDGYIAKFSSSGNLLWSRFLGGSESEFVLAFCIEPNNSIILTGNTGSQDFPIRNSPILNYNKSSFQGSYDGFIAQLNSQGQLMYSSFLGSLNSIGVKKGVSLIKDSDGNLLITGELGVMPSDFFIAPNNNSYLQTQNISGDDGFIMKFNSQTIITNNCNESNSEFDQLYQNILAISPDYSDRVSLDLHVHEYTFTVNTSKTLCAIGYQGNQELFTNNTPYLIELIDKQTGTILYSGNHVLDFTSTQHFSVPPINLISGDKYILRRSVSDLNAFASQLIGRVMWGNYNLTFPKSFGNITILSSDFRHLNHNPSGYSPLRDVAVPFIDIIFENQ